jgi:glycosyltransferase involved in cell wall biosynthesis
MNAIQDMPVQRPLVSISIITYQHEAYIEECIRSALAQTYRPLEVVLVDDCSRDKTFEVASRVADEYHGDVRLQLYRNTQNLGIVKNHNKAWSLCAGEIIAVQCGDDRSTPQRVERIVQELETTDPVDYVFSDIEAIDQSGRRLGHEARSWIGWPQSFGIDEFVRSGAWGGFLGCSAAFRRRLFSKYGPIADDVLAEDCVMPFRGALERGVRFIPEKLLEYRLHAAMFSALDHASREPKVRALLAKGRLGNIKEWIRCLKISGRDEPKLMRAMEQHLRAREFNVDCLEASPLFACVKALQAIVDGVAPRVVLGALRKRLTTGYS